jgi:hypothetical protein
MRSCSQRLRDTAKGASPAAELSRDGHQKAFSVADALVLVACACVAVIYAFPLFHNVWNYSCGDGESYQTINAVIRSTLIDYRQFPFWNPYSGGGNVMLAHPESNFLSPLFVPILLLGPVVGVKIQIVIYYIIGLAGMYLLCRYLNFKVLPAFLAAVLFNCNSYLSNHLNVGYFIWMTILWMPWVFLFYLKSCSSAKNIVWCALVMALVLLEGGVHHLIMIFSFLVLYASFESVRSKSFKPLLILFLAMGLFALLSGIKLIPMMQFIHDYPRRAYQMVLPYVPYWTFVVAMLDRGWYGRCYLLPQPNFTGQEFLAYIGIIPFVLLIAGCIRCFKKYWPIILTLVVFIFIAYGRGSFIDVWPLIKRLPGFNNQFITVRNVIVIVFCGSLIIGYYLSTWNCSGAKNVFLSIMVMCVTADLIAHGWYYIAAMPNEPVTVEKSAFVQEDTERLYPTFLKGHGNILFWRPGRIDCAAVSVKNPSYRGEVYLLNGNGTARMEEFTPNKLRVIYTAQDDDTLVVNQNYYKGWWAFGENRLPVSSSDGLISVKVAKGRGAIALYYFPLMFILGSICSLAGAAVSLWVLLSQPKRKNV